MSRGIAALNSTRSTARLPRSRFDDALPAKPPLTSGRGPDGIGRSGWRDVIVVRTEDDFVVSAESQWIGEAMRARTVERRSADVEALEGCDLARRS
jgi:hypothetical protein